MNETGIFVILLSQDGFETGSSETKFKHISSRKMGLRPQTSSEQADVQSRPQVSREILPVLDMPIHGHAWVYITCQEIPDENCLWKGIPSYPITDLCFNQEPIRLQHGPLEILNPFLLILFQHCVSKSEDVLPLFLLY